MKLAIRSTLYVVALTVLLGGVYPAAVTAVSKVFWKDKANGSLVTAGGRVVGSELIGQNFKGDRTCARAPPAPARTGTTRPPRPGETRARRTRTSQNGSRMPSPPRARTVPGTRGRSPRTS